MNHYPTTSLSGGFDGLEDRRSTGVCGEGLGGDDGDDPELVGGACDVAGGDLGSGDL